jgi:hypothetical protein
MPDNLWLINRSSDAATFRILPGTVEKNDQQVPDMARKFNIKADCCQDLIAHQGGSPLFFRAACQRLRQHGG